ncbi:MAG: hypothetical protein LBU87_06190 [Lactobacillales bacterium]|jgi:hypothetical protein|nr:hypothetical protein [Lactobacillales bacterium]
MSLKKSLKGAGVIGPVTTDLYIIKYFPGSFVAEESTEVCTDKKSAMEKIKQSSKCFGFQFATQRNVAVNVDGSVEVFTQPMKHEETMYYIGQVFDKKGVEKLPDTRMLLQNMELNGWDHVVQTKLGNFRPVGKDTIVLDENMKQVFPPINIPKGRTR